MASPPDIDRTEGLREQICDDQKLFRQPLDEGLLATLRVHNAVKIAIVAFVEAKWHMKIYPRNTLDSLRKGG